MSLKLFEFINLLFHCFNLQARKGKAYNLVHKPGSTQTLQEPSWATFLPMQKTRELKSKRVTASLRLMHVPFIRFNLCPIPRKFDGRRDVGTKKGRDRGSPHETGERSVRPTSAKP